jgi:hypothetical protein
MDDALRVALWNVFLEHHGVVLAQRWRMDRLGRPDSRTLVAGRIWAKAMQRPLDELAYDRSKFVQQLKNCFFVLEWFSVYEFVEFACEAKNFGVSFETGQRSFQRALEDHRSGYRLIDGIVVPIASETEVRSVAEAVESARRHGLAGVDLHLRSALERLSDRKAPDYRNCIKEAISAVEALCGIIAADKQATLGQALKVVEQHVDLHRALTDAWMKLYGWTSDDQGIRHALLEEPSLTQADARYMLVSCSAFVGLLIEKCAASGIELKAR